MRGRFHAPRWLSLTLVALSCFGLSASAGELRDANAAADAKATDYSELPALPASSQVPVAVADPQVGATKEVPFATLPSDPAVLPSGYVRDPSASSDNVDVFAKGGADHLLRVYPGDVNYQAAGGDWLPIDATLKSDAGGWQNGANSFDVSFPSTLDPADPVTVALGDGGYSYWPDGGSAAVGAKNDVDSLTYQGVFPGVDLRYDLLSSGFEERIALAKPGTDTVSFRVQTTKGFSLRLESWDEVSVISGDAVVGVMRMPIAVDSSTADAGDHVRSPVAYELDDLGGGAYELTLRLDSAFLAKAVYPVTIDPARTTLSVDAKRDGWTDFDCGTCSNEGDSLLYAGPWGGVRYTFVRFDVAGYVQPGRDTLTAIMNLWASTGGGQTVNALRVTEDWPYPAALTWNNQPAVATTATDSANGASGSWISWDVKPDYQQILEGSAVNGGERLSSGSQHVFYSMENAATTGRPVLSLFYNDRPAAPTLDSPAAGNPAITYPSPALKATVGGDPNGDDVYVRYQLCLQPLNTNYDCSVKADFDSHVAAQSDWLDSGDTWTVPAGTLKDGGQYYWRAQSADGPENGTGVWAPVPGEDFPTSVFQRFTVTLPHLGADDDWTMWSTQAGNGVDLEVNAASGNLFVQYPLETLATAIGPLEISLTYNSQDGKSYGAGRGWVPVVGSGPTSREIPVDLDVKDGGDGVVIRLRDGERRYFSKRSDITTVGYYEGSGAAAGIVRSGDDSWKWVTPDGGWYSFNLAGNLIKASPATTDFGKPGLVYVYNASGQLSTVTDPLSGAGNVRKVTLHYNGTGQLDSISDWASHTWTLHYLTTNTSEIISSIDDPITNTAVSFHYLSDATTGNVKLLNKVTDAGTTGSGADWQVVYQAPTAPQTYAVVASVKTPGDQLGGVNTTSFLYNSAPGSSYTGQLAQNTVVRDPRAGAGNPAFETRYDFNDQGLATRVVHPTDSLGHTPVTSMLWDQNGNLVCERAPAANATGTVNQNTLTSGCDDPANPTANGALNTQYAYSTKPPYLLVSKTLPSATWDGSGFRAATTYEYDANDTYTGLVQENYANPTLEGIPDYKQVDTGTPANIDWGTGSPTNITNVNDFSVRWTGTLHITGAPNGQKFRFRLGADDASRLMVNGEVLATCFTRNNDTFVQNCGNGAKTLKLWNGDHQIMVEYRDFTGGARVDLEWDAGDANGSFVNIPDTVLQPDTHLLTKTVRTSDTRPTLTTTYAYSSKVRGLLSSRTESDGVSPDRVTTYPSGFYDDFGRIEKEVVQRASGATFNTLTSYDANNGCPSNITDRTGTQTALTCDALGHPTSASVGFNPMTGSDGNPVDQPVQTRVTDTDHDALGRPWRVSTPDDLNDGNPRMASRTDYYPDGLIKATCTGPAAALANPCNRADANQRVTEYTYYPSTRVATKKLPAEDPIGAPNTQVTLTYEYDAAGNVTKITEAATGQTSRVTTSIYDGENRATSVTVPAASAATTTSYNATGQGAGLTGPVVTTTSPSVTATGTVNVATVAKVDPLGRPVSSQVGSMQATAWGYGSQVSAGFVGDSVTDPFDAWTKTIYTGWGEARVVTRPTGAGDAPKDLVYSYDGTGLVKSVLDRNLNVTSYTYDGMGRLLQSDQTLSGSTISWRYVYDGAGERVEVTDPDGRVREFTFDLLGRPSSNSEFEASTSVYGRTGTKDTTTNSYDQWGDLITVDDPLAGVLRFEYTHRGMVKRRYQDTSGTLSGDERFEYDVWGEQTAARLGTGSAGDTWLTYDSAGRLDRVVKGSSLAGGVVQSDYGYYPVSGQRQNVLDLAGTTTYLYNTSGQLDSVTDPLSASPAKTTYSYDYMANTITRIDTAGLKTIRFLDKAGRPSDQTVVKNGTTTPMLAEFKYTYDNDSNVVSAVQNVGAGSNSWSGTWGYGYDSLGRLTSMDPPGSANTTTFNYDGAGNRTKETFNGGTPQITVYDGAGRPDKTTNGVGGATTRDYTFNHADEMVGYVAGASNWSYQYDAWGRETQAQLVNGPTTTLSYSYDALARLVTRTKTGASAINYAYQGLSENPTTVTVGSTVSTYAYSPSGPLVEKGSSVRVLGRNLHGDVAFFANPSTNAVTDSIAYDAWGKKTQTGSNAALGQLGYQSDITDPDTGFVDMGTRLYDPAQGRFTTRDILFGDPTNPQSLNQYAYGGDSPVVYMDPTGMLANASSTAKQSTSQTHWSALHETLSTDAYAAQLTTASTACLHMGGCSITIAPPPPPAPPKPSGGGGFFGSLKSAVSGGAGWAWDHKVEIGVNVAAIALTIPTAGVSDELALEFDAALVTEEVGSVAVEEGGSALLADAAEETGGASRTLFHYTDEAGHNGILESGKLRPSLRSVNPNDARYGNGQYLSDISPGTRTSAQLSRAFLGNPFQGARFTHYVGIDVSGLNVVEGRAGVFVIPNEGPLSLAGRIVRSGVN
jgi:RHS repeat-associated protein